MDLLDDTLGDSNDSSSSSSSSSCGPGTGTGAGAGTGTGTGTGAGTGTATTTGTGTGTGTGTEDGASRAATRASTTKRLVSFLLGAFDKLPARGKPQKDREWTVLAGVFVRIQSAHCHRLVSLATGTKCVGLDKMADDGGVLNDCHAEVLARRGLKLFLLQEAALACEGIAESCVFQSAKIQSEPSLSDSNSFSSSPSSSSCTGGGSAAGPATASTADVLEPASDLCLKKLSLRPGIEFTLVVTETPCGEASNYHQQAGPTNSTERVAIFRETGAKPVPSLTHEQPSRTAAVAGIGTGVSASTRVGAARKTPCPAGHDDSCHGGRRNSSTSPRGPLRTKSARSDTLETRRTVSMSCSDKLALWNCVGFQGALLSQVVSQPMRFSTLVLAIGGTATTAASGVDAASLASARGWVEAAEKATSHALSRGSESPRVVVDAEISFRYGRAVVQERLQKREKDQSAKAARKAGQDRDLTATAFIGDSAKGRDQRAGSTKSKPKKKRCPRASPCGTSLVWVHSAGLSTQTTATAGRKGGVGVEAECHTDPMTCGSHEVLVAVHGLKQGSRKRRREEPTNSKTRSMVCKAALFSTFCQSFTAIDKTRPSDSQATPTYHQAKAAAAAYRIAKARLFSPTGPFHGWLRGDPGLESFQLQ